MVRTVQQLFDLRGRTALVTGGVARPALLVARALGEAGARIMLCGPQADALEQAMADLQADGIDTRWVAAADAGQLCRAVDETLHRMGPLHILAGWLAPGQDDVRGDPEAWLRRWPEQLRRQQQLICHAVHRSMIPQGLGRIITVFGPFDPALGGRAALKRAQDEALAQNRALAGTWASEQVSVNAIELTAPLDELNGPASPYAEGLKGLALLYASEAGRSITGQCVMLGARPAE